MPLISKSYTLEGAAATSDTSTETTGMGNNTYHSPTKSVSFALAPVTRIAGRKENVVVS